MRFIHYIFILLLTAVLANALASTKTAASSTLQTALPQNRAVEAFIQDTAAAYHLPAPAVAQVMSKAHINPSIIDIMNRPYEAQPWGVYRSHFLTQQRIQSGVDFWNAHVNMLQKAEKQYGVPASVIIAILGVETNYGQRLGQFSTLDALSTLAFHYPKRQQFFKHELAEFIALSYKNKFDPAKITGSYAGALGQAQFMPSSYRHYAVDFSGSGRVDLFHNTDDAIGSIANYLHENGWRRNQPIATPVYQFTSSDQILSNNHRKTPYTLATLEKTGITIKPHYPSNLAVNVFALDSQHNTYHWVGFHNFYVITRYNTSLLYAMAVYQLSEQIKSLRQKQVVV